MEIRTSENGQETTMELVGWLDIQAAPELEKAINDLEEGESLVIDMKELEYISSSGLRQLVAAYKKYKGDMKLKNVPASILDILRTTGLDKKLKVEK